jgi:hypothetical protein
MRSGEYVFDLTQDPDDPDYVPPAPRGRVNDTIPAPGTYVRRDTDRMTLLDILSLAESHKASQAEMNAILQTYLNDEDLPGVDGEDVDLG